MHYELIVAIVIRHTQFIRELTAVSLYHIGDTSTERALNARQFFKDFVTGGVACITQPLLVHFIGVLRQYSPRRTASVNQLISNIVRTVRIRRDQSNDDGINTQRRPCGRLNFLSGGWLLRQSGPV
ncbi:Uncharacterised protein [Salmonella enterica subsp. enterica serovar Typhi]|nr:Uncharacterised protein [Salmonella enterica subsp. enterica serovar Typhi]